MSKGLGLVLGVGAIASSVVFAVFGLNGLTGGVMSAFSDTDVIESAAESVAPSVEASIDMPNVESADRISHPPVRQSSAAGAYELVVVASDDWRTPLANLQLYKDGSMLWQKALPHQYGPRFFSVTPKGQVLLLDEYINVASAYAITLLDETGTEVAQYSFDDIQQVLAVAPAELTRQASGGLWISAAPVVSEVNGAAGEGGEAGLGDRAQVKTGGTTLEVDLTTGKLSRRDDL